ncbi:MAG: hypothetical protein U0V72_11385 [Cytophagales bacterium]
MRKTISAFFILGILSCTNSKIKKNDAYTYNEKLVKVIKNIDSTRNLIGEKQNENTNELKSEVLTFSTTINNSLNELGEINYKSDTLFKNSVIKYVLLNKGISEIDIPNIIKLKTKLETANAKDKEEIYTLMYQITENINKNLEGSLKEVEISQNIFSKRNNVMLK